MDGFAASYSANRYYIQGLKRLFFSRSKVAKPKPRVDGEPDYYTIEDFFMGNHSTTLRYPYYIAASYYVQCITLKYDFLSK